MLFSLIFTIFVRYNQTNMTSQWGYPVGMSPSETFHQGIPTGMSYLYNGITCFRPRENHGYLKLEQCAIDTNLVTIIMGTCPIYLQTWAHMLNLKSISSGPHAVHYQTTMNTPIIIVKNSNVTNNISHLLFEDVYKNRESIPA